MRDVSRHKSMDVLQAYVRDADSGITPGRGCCKPDCQVFGSATVQLGSTEALPISSPVFLICGLSCKTMFNKEV
jgi:hypothetical protein